MSSWEVSSNESIFLNASDIPPTMSFQNDTTAAGGRQMSLLMQTVAAIMYSAVWILALGGNTIVCYIVLSFQRMRTVTNYFIVNLACSDILMATLCIPPTFVVNVLTEYWPFASPLCPIVFYAQTVAVFLNAFTLVGVSLDRYVAIIYPLKPRLTTAHAMAVIALIWLLSLAVSLPVALRSRLVQRQADPPRENCEEVWPYAHQRYVYSMSVMALQYFVPLFGLAFTYARIAIVIWGSKTPGEAQNGRDQRMAASKRKMVKMMIAVVLIYAACWLPLHTITLVGDSYDTIYDYPYIQPLWAACHWLAMSNCCYNPIVYCWMNARFRDGFRHVLRWLPCVDERANSQFDKRSRVPTYVTTTMTSASRNARRGERGSLCEPDPGHEDSDDGLAEGQLQAEQVALRRLDNGQA